MRVKKDAKNLMDDAKPFQLDAVRVKLVKEAPLFRSFLCKILMMQ